MQLLGLNLDNSFIIMSHFTVKLIYCLRAGRRSKMSFTRSDPFVVRPRAPPEALLLTIGILRAGMLLEGPLCIGATP